MPNIIVMPFAASMHANQASKPFHELAVEQTKKIEVGIDRIEWCHDDSDRESDGLDGGPGGYFAGEIKLQEGTANLGAAHGPNGPGDHSGAGAKIVVRTELPDVSVGNRV